MSNIHWTAVDRAEDFMVTRCEHSPVQGGADYAHDCELCITAMIEAAEEAVKKPYLRHLTPKLIAELAHASSEGMDLLEARIEALVSSTKEGK